MLGEYARDARPNPRPRSPRTPEAGEAVSHQRGEDQETTEEPVEHGAPHPSSIEEEE